MKLFNLLLPLGVFLFFGCGSSDRPELVPVSGQVLYRGEPVVGAQVVFTTEGSPRSAVGITDSNGKFRLTTFDTNDGAVPGNHQVAISKPKPKEDSGAKDIDITSGDPGEMYSKMMTQVGRGQVDDAVEHELPAKYAKPSESGLTREVIAGETNEFTFDLDD